MRTRRPARPLPLPAGRGRRVTLLVSRFHETLGRALLEGAQQTLHRAGVAARAMRVVWVPGAFELPVAAAWAATQRPRPDAIIALGIVLRGQTTQYQVLAQAVMQGLTDVAVQHRLPVTCGVVVAETLAQARARSRGAEHRGVEAALAALQLLATLKKAR